MASTFKNLSPDDKISTKTLLHEAIPITGTIVSGTYADNNIKNFSHGMFQSVYDYPYLSSSANHIFDISTGFANSSALSASSGAAAAQRAKKINIYNQMAQVLVGYDKTGSIQLFDEDGDIAAGGTKLTECMFLSFSRLLVKDEIKKGTFNLELGVNSDYSDPFSKRIKIIDESASDSFKINSPVGEYGILVADTTVQGDGVDNLTNDTGTLAAGIKCGLIFYQAGVVALSNKIFDGASAQAAATLACEDGDDTTAGNIPNEKDHVIIISTDGTKKVYVIVDDGAAGTQPATGAAMTAASDTGASTLGSTIAALGDCVAVNLDLTGGAVKQADVINELRTAILSGGGHGVAKLTVTGPAATTTGAKSITMTQADGTAANRHLGNTVVTKSFSGDSATKFTFSNFSGGGSGGILATSVGAPKMSNASHGNSLQSLVTGSSISGSADALRHRIYNLSFNNTVELNSTIYFCRINHNEYNYSANPTYLSSSQIRVKENSSDNPVAYITTVGLYSADNQLLAVAKLSEPLRKDPTIEYTLRARLDY